MLFPDFLVFSFFITQFASMGTSVWDNINDAIIANATAMDSGRNIDFAIPVINNEGTNTERILNNINNLGTTIYLHASQIAL